MLKLRQISGDEVTLVDAAMADMRVEVAIGAFGQAERPMHIDPERLAVINASSRLNSRSHQLLE